MKQIESFVRNWPRTVFLMLLGGLIGYILWMYLPQQYTAVTHLSVVIDYNRTGKLDDMEQDRMMGITEDILHSDDVMEKVFRQTTAADFPSFFAQTGITRTNQTWSLKISGKDPKEIGTAALLWLDTAYEELNKALEHAAKAEALRNEIDGLSRCIQDSTAAQMTVICSESTAETLNRISALTAQLNDEMILSKGIPASIRIGSKNPDQLEIHPASRYAAADTMLGILAGLLASAAFAWIPKENDPE